jgi:hypothetical protein
MVRIFVKIRALKDFFFFCLGCKLISLRVFALLSDL